MRLGAHHREVIVIPGECLDAPRSPRLRTVAVDVAMDVVEGFSSPACGWHGRLGKTKTKKSRRTLACQTRYVTALHAKADATLGHWLWVQASGRQVVSCSK